MAVNVTNSTIITKLESSELYFANLMHSNLEASLLGLVSSSTNRLNNIYYLIRALRIRVDKDVFDDTSLDLYQNLEREIPFDNGTGNIDPYYIDINTHTPIQSGIVIPDFSTQFIQNQSTLAQNPGNFWINGNGRVASFQIDNAPVNPTDGVRLEDLNLPDSILSGLSLSISGSNVLIQPGTWRLNNIVYHTIAVVSKPIDAQDPTLSRYDLLYADNNNTIHIVSGTASVDPIIPDVPTGTIAIGTVLITPTSVTTNPILPTGFVDTTTNQNNIAGNKTWTGSTTFTNSQIQMTGLPLVNWGDNGTFDILRQGTSNLAVSNRYRYQDNNVGLGPNLGDYIIRYTLSDQGITVNSFRLIIVANDSVGDVVGSHNKAWDFIINPSKINGNWQEVKPNYIDEALSTFTLDIRKNSGLYQVRFRRISVEGTHPPEGSSLQIWIISTPLNLLTIVNTSGNDVTSIPIYSESPITLFENNLYDNNGVQFAKVGTGGSVTSLTDNTANGITTTWTNRTTTPVPSISLGAITPTSVNGVSAATIAFLDATSSVQTQLNSKQASLGFTPENVTNKATSFTTLNNTLYPTTQAVSTYISGLGYLTTSAAASTYQPILVSGTNIKTINSTILLGSGNILLQTPLVAGTDYLTPTGSAASLTGFPTFNQNTTGSAAKLTTARLLAGNSFDGSANTPFINKFIVQGTTDSGLTGAQFLGSLSTGIVKNTTTTGVLSIATAGTDYQIPLIFTTTGTGAATYNSGTGALNIPTPSAGFVNPMTTLGDIIYGGTSGTATRLAGNTTTTNLFLTSKGVSGAATAPIYFDLFNTSNQWGQQQVFNNGGLIVSGANAINNSNSNFWVPNNAAPSSVAISQNLWSGVTTLLGRTSFAGSTSTTLATGQSSTQVAFGACTIDTFTSGTHPYVLNSVFLPPVITPHGTAIVTNSANVLIYGNPTGGTNNYGLLIQGGATVGYSGSTSGTISILAQAAAGTYNFNLPTTSGTTGQVLTSAGGLTSPMTWTTSNTYITNTSGTDAAYTISLSSGDNIILPAITAARTVTFPTIVDGKVFYIYNLNSSANTWSIAGSPTVKSPALATQTTVVNQTYSAFIGSTTQSAWIRLF